MSEGKQPMHTSAGEKKSPDESADDEDLKDWAICWECHGWIPPIKAAVECDDCGFVAHLRCAPRGCGNCPNPDTITVNTSELPPPPGAIAAAASAAANGNGD